MFLCLAVTTANPLFCLVGLLQLIGLLVAGATRFTQGTPYERTGQWSCLIALGLIGTICGVTLQLGPGIATTSAVTLTLMTMIVVIELPRRRPSPKLAPPAAAALLSLHTGLVCFVPGCQFFR